MWTRPVPTVGDRTSAAERAADPAGWAFAEADRDALARVVAARRDIRRFRPDPVPAETLDAILAAAHRAPSVGHSQPWRFVIVRDPATRARAAILADRARLAQAAAMDFESGRHLADLDLEGIREAPLGLVVCCDRRAAPAGVLGRATFHEADMWSCACAIENLWLAARAEGLGVGWVTLFEPGELAALVGAPAGVETLGWLCVGWPDERPPAPGLERRGWSRRQALADVVIIERWPEGQEAAPAPPGSRLAPPPPAAVVAAHDTGDRILTPPGSLGVLDRAVDRLLAAQPDADEMRGVLVVAAADHPVTQLGVSAFPVHVTRDVALATIADVSVGAVAARQAGLDVILVDAGVEGAALEGARMARPNDAKGDLAHTDAMSPSDAKLLVDAGVSLGAELGDAGYAAVALGEVGVGNTTVAAVLAAALLQADPDQLMGLGSGADTEIVARKRDVARAALARVATTEPMGLLAALGGGEVAVLTGVVLGAASKGLLVILDGMATSVAALSAVQLEPAVAAHLVAGQRSREQGHAAVLQALGLEPLLDLRLRAGEGAGAAMAAGLLRTALRIRRETARTGDGAA